MSFYIKVVSKEEADRRRMLEAVAELAELNVEWHDRYGVEGEEQSGFLRDGSTPWDPLENTDDALDIAMRLRFVMFATKAYAVVPADLMYEELKKHYADFNGNRNAAMRHAIVYSAYHKYMTSPPSKSS